MLFNKYLLSQIISIHALQAECDAVVVFYFCRNFDFYPRTPSGVRRNGNGDTQSTDEDFYPRTPSGVRLPIGCLTKTSALFLSTHSKRSATFLTALFPRR